MIRRAFLHRMTMAALASGMLGMELLGKRETWKPPGESLPALALPLPDPPPWM